MLSVRERITSMADHISVEVAFATPDRQVVIPLNVPVGSTLRDALRLSCIETMFPEFDFNRLKLGVFGKVCADDHLLSEHDRVEVYRPLILTPQEARRQRAKGGAAKNGQKR